VIRTLDLRIKSDFPLIFYRPTDTRMR